jgi:hypothetical protein
MTDTWTGLVSRHGALASDPGILCHIRDDEVELEQGFSEFIRFPLLIIIPSLLHTHPSRPPEFWGSSAPVLFTEHPALKIPELNRFPRNKKLAIDRLNYGATFRSLTYILIYY